MKKLLLSVTLLTALVPTACGAASSSSVSLSSASSSNSTGGFIADPASQAVVQYVGDNLAYFNDSLVLKNDLQKYTDTLNEYNRMFSSEDVLMDYFKQKGIPAIEFKRFLPIIARTYLVPPSGKMPDWLYEYKADESDISSLQRMALESYLAGISPIPAVGISTYPALQAYLMEKGFSREVIDGALPGIAQLYDKKIKSYQDLGWLKSYLSPVSMGGLIKKMKAVRKEYNAIKWNLDQ